MTTSVPLQGRIYIVRVLFCLATLGLLAVNDIVCRQQAGDHLGVLIGGLLYPHLGHLMFGRLDVSRKRGHALFVADGIFVGAVIAALGFTPLPGVILVVICLFNWMVVGGVPLLVLGSLSMVISMAVTGVIPDRLPADIAACHAVNGIAALIAIGYFLGVGRIIHRLVGELRRQQVESQARSDTAHLSNVMAERALLAVLPPSAARSMAANGELPTELIQEATLLRFNFHSPEGEAPGLEEMQGALAVCERILARHGLELVKSLGNRMLAFSRGTSGPADAVLAYREIDTYFKDHGISINVQGILHQGPAMLGLVQAERMNLDLFGTSVNELESAVTGIVPQLQQEPGLLISQRAYQNLSSPLACAPAPQTETGPIFFRYRT